MDKKQQFARLKHDVLDNGVSFIKKQPFLITLLSALLAIVVLFLYVAISWRTGSANSDNASIVLQSMSILHGNVFLSGWWIAPDNYWTLDMPFYIAGLLFRGMTPALMQDIPALIFLLVVIASLFLVKGNGDSPAVALGRATIFFLLALPAAFISFFLLHGPYHTATILYILLALLVLDKLERVKIRGANLAYLILFFLLLTIAEVGDPLTFWIAVIPISVLYAFRCYHNNQKKDLLVVVSAIIAFLAGTFIMFLIKTLGGFHLIPLILQFSTISNMPHNLSLTIEGLLLVFGTDFFGQPVLSLTTIMLLLRLAAIIILSYLIIKQFRTNGHKLPIIDQILLAGIALDILEYLFSTQAVDLTTTRFLAPVLVYGSILLGRAMIKLRLNIIRAIPIVLLILTSAFSTYHILKLPISPTTYAALGQWFQGHNLTYGYGSYWDSSIITIETKGSVKVRPIIQNSNRLAPFHWQSSSTWYRSSEYANFIIFDNADWGGVNYNTAVATFGQPVKTEQVGGYTIMIWNKNISPLLQT